MRVILALLSLFFVICPAFAQNYFEEGKSAFYKSNYNQAKKYFLQELQANPQNYPCMYFLAHTYVYLGDIDKAKTEYSRVITYSPVLTLRKLAMQSMYNLNHPQEEIKFSGVEANQDNYIDFVKLEENYVRWGKFPISVYVAPNDNSTLIKNAFAHWHKVSNGLVSFNFVSNINSAQITVSMVDKLALPYNNAFEAGHATINAKNGIIYKAHIDLLQKNPNTQEVLSQDVIYATALHEIGHALGLQGHSPNDTDLMSETNTKGIKTITKRDLNTLKLLYK